MNTRFLLLFCLLFSFQTLQLQAQSELSSIDGYVEEADHTPAAYATVQLKRAADSSLVKAGYTDEKGRFSLPGLSGGVFFLEVSYVGFITHRSERIALPENAKLELPEIMLVQAIQELEAVVVTARKPIIELKADRTVFNVEGSINAIGSDAMELLQKAPGVVVDNNDQIMVQGKSGVQIFINDKPSPLGGADLAAYLRSLQSTDIEAIEIITNPSSRYDAEGNAGIINIRLKRSLKIGTNGTITSGVAYGKNARFNNAFQISHREQKLNLFLNYTNYTGDRWRFGDYFRVQNGYSYDQRTTQLVEETNHSLRGGADYQWNERYSIGILVNGYFNDEVFNSQGNTLIAEVSNPPHESLRATNKIAGLRKNMQGNLNYQYKSANGSHLNMDFDVAMFANRLNSYQPNYYSDLVSGMPIAEHIYTNTTPTDIDLISFKVDYQQALWGGLVELGAKASMVGTDNTLDFYEIIQNVPVKDVERSNRFLYDEQILASYLNYKRQISDKLQASGGLRLEQTNSVGELLSLQNLPEDYVERSYLNLFPSAGLSYQIDETHNLRLSFSRRIDRPNYQDLNPFEFRLDELSYQKGNAFLRPQYSNSLQLNYGRSSGLNVSLNYTITEDYFTRLNDTIEIRRSFITTRNLAKQTVLNLSVSAPFAITQWWSGYANVNMYQTDNRADFGDGKVVDLRVRAVNVFAQQNFNLTDDISLELSGFYNSPGIWGGVFEMDAMWGIDLGAQKKFFDGKMNVKLSVTDLFYTKQWHGYSDFAGMQMDATGGWESRQLRLNVNYAFGNSSLKSHRIRATGLDEEQKRLEGGQ